MSAKKQQIMDAISQVLDSMGVSGLEEDIFGEGEGVGQENNVPIWSQLQVGVNDEGRGPIHDKGALFGFNKMSKPPMVDNYGMPAAGDQEEMMLATGLV